MNFSAKITARTGLAHFDVYATNVNDAINTVLKGHGFSAQIFPITVAQKNKILPDVTVFIPVETVDGKTNTKYAQKTYLLANLTSYF